MTVNTADSPDTTTTYHTVLAATKRRVEIEELDKAIGKLSRHMNASNYQLMVLIREFDERAGWLKWGFKDGLSWLRWRCDLSANAARDKLRVAHALKDLPAMSAAFETGKLSYSKIRSMTRIATPANEQELIDLAYKLSAAHVEAHCRQRTNASKASTALANRAYENRTLRLWRNENTGVMNVAIELSLEEGALFEQAVEKASVRLAAEGSTYQQMDGNTTPWRAVQVDAVMMIIRQYLAGPTQSGETNDGPVSTSTADHYQVVVHVDEKALSKGETDDTVENKGSSELPVETVRRLCCDGSVVPIVENGKGEPLNVGRKVRTVTTAIRRALWARDKGCAWPGCHCKRFVDAHHIKHWADGGETSVSNMLLLCTRHHRLVHEGGYTVSLDHKRRHYFRRLDGKAVPHSGYSQDDWEDDYSENVSVEQLVAHVRSGKNSREFFQSDNRVEDSSGCYHLH